MFGLYGISFSLYQWISKMK